MCNFHTLACNESLTLKIGGIQIRQLLRLYPGSWLEAGSIYLPELRVNAKFECHPPTPVCIQEQLEFLRRHDQQTQRLHFLYVNKSQATLNVPTSTHNKRPSNVGLTNPTSISSCACLGGSSTYYTLVQGEQFFKNTYRLSEQPSFGRSLFRPEVHVIHSHPIFKQKYNWITYEYMERSEPSLSEEEIFYPFDFCTQPKQTTSVPADNQLRHSVPPDLYALSRSSSSKHLKQKSFQESMEHKRSSSSIPFNSQIQSSSSSSSTTATSDVYLTPNEQRSLINSSHSSLNSTLFDGQRNLLESSSLSSLTMIHQASSTMSSPLQSNLNLMSKSSNYQNDFTRLSFHSSSSDSLNALEEILQRQQTHQTSNLIADQVRSYGDSF